MNYNVISDCRGMYEQEIIETILHDRGINDTEHFLNPIPDDLLPPDSLTNIDKAKIIVEQGIKENKRFGVHFDADTDGISAGTIMCRYLKHYTGKVFPYINEGRAHGLAGQDPEQFSDADILIIVDSLDNNIYQYKQLNNQGIQIIVLDHHVIDENIPYDKYVTLVSSQRDYGNPELSGSGVVRKFCKYLDGHFMKDYADEYADLAACGLIADMMDMSERSMENRYIVSKGLKNLKNPAMKKIIGGFEFNSTSVAFSIAPLINAANRMRCNEYAMNAFPADDNKDVLKYIKELKKCRENQNADVDSLMGDIVLQAEKQKNKKAITVFIDSENGIAGLISNKLPEKYRKPIFVLKETVIDGIEYYAGSARADGLKDFRKICSETGLAGAFGHELAFGVQIKKTDYEDFIKSVEQSLEHVKFDFSKTVDIELDIADITSTLIDKIKELDKISGRGFSPVNVKIDSITDYEVSSMSQGKHLVLKPNDCMQLIKWNWTGSFESMEENSMLGEPITVIGRLDSGFLGGTFSLKVICSEVIESTESVKSMEVMQMRQAT